MKKKLIFLCLLLFIAYILTAPKDAVNAASVGLVLWYTRVLPTLLPFVILSNILMDSNYLQYLNKITAPLVSRLIPVSDNGAFVLLSGFLFGVPIGSKNCAALLASGKITRREADVLFIITNNISPVFVTSFILYTQLKLSHLSAVTLLILYFPFYAFITKALFIPPPSKPPVLMTNIPLESVPSFFSIIVSLFMHTRVVKYTQPKIYEKRTSIHRCFQERIYHYGKSSSDISEN